MKAISYASALMLITCPALGSSFEPVGGTATVPSCDPVKLRAICDRLCAEGPHCLGGYDHLNSFIDQLASACDEEALRVIIREEMPGVGHAAACYANVVAPRKAIGFARTLRPCSRGWRAMVWSMSFGGTEVREYIRETSRTGGPCTRGFCYELALSRGWDDLVEAAWTDIDSADELCQGLYADCKLGDLARDYLDRFDNKRVIPPRK